jgi:hypothetical protein
VSPRDGKGVKIKLGWVAGYAECIGEQVVLFGSGRWIFFLFGRGRDAVVQIDL